MIKLTSVSKIYHLEGISVPALTNVSFEIENGSFVAIMGPSGSGKSTLMHLLGALDTPTSGEVIIQNQNINKLSESELAVFRNETIGFVFQSFNLLPKTTALQNVILPLLYNQKTPPKQRVILAKSWLEKVGLADRMDHLTNQLSGGQQQRIAIARAMVTNPKFILADEPTGNLDSKTGESVMKIFTDLHKKGKTIILITHEENIAAYAKRIIKIKDGKVVS